jgi:hypothetical protein
MLRKYITGAMICLLTATAIAQDEAKPKDEEIPKPLFGDKKIRPVWMEKLRYGGNVYAQVWGAFNAELSPMVGYEIGNSGKTVVGTGLAFNYVGQFRAGDFGYGARLFVRQNVFKGVFAHVEYEMMNAKGQYFLNYTPPANLIKAERIWGGTPLLGLGIYRGGKQTKGSFIAILINPLYPKKGYQSPFTIGGANSPLSLRVGFF